MNRLYQKYQTEVVPKLEADFGYTNKMAVPKITKLTLNVGIPSAKGETKFIELVEKTLTRIGGQKPVLTKAKQSISSFKTREGQIVGAKVTLRGERMYEFIDKLINITLPTVRDFRGLNKKSVDAKGNLTLGFKEHLPFPEINPDEVENVHGLEVCLSTTARNSREGLSLFQSLGFPFAEKNLGESKKSKHQ
ncbi:MAG TPA: 50S ribosomal protein L5 [Candidatus Paceibacterota bacterium]|nr:50S ribosomal protein L5 [Candidatus Paceibacterota bacterium]